MNWSSKFVRIKELHSVALFENIFPPGTIIQNIYIHMVILVKIK